MKKFFGIIAATALLCLASGSNQFFANDHATHEFSVLEKMAATHGYDEVSGNQILTGDLLATAGERQLIKGKLTTTLNMSKIHYDLGEGNSLLVNDEGVFLSPESFEMPKAHFMSKTWPYFILTPWKLTTDSGINIMDSGLKMMDGTEYNTYTATFGAGVGDAPDDYYVMYLDKETARVDAIQFISSYGGGDPDEATKYVLTYDEYADIDGLAVPVKMAEYVFNESEDGTGRKVVGVEFLNPKIVDVPPSLFVTPENSTKLEKGS